MQLSFKNGDHARLATATVTVCMHSNNECGAPRGLSALGVRSMKETAEYWSWRGQDQDRSRCLVSTDTAHNPTQGN